MRKLYKYSHSVLIGGWHFIQRIESGNKVFVDGVAEQVETALIESMKSLQAEDLTIKICGNHFHVICHISGRYAPITFINSARIAADYILHEFGVQEELDDEHVFGGIDDLDPECARKELQKIGCE